MAASINTLEDVSKITLSQQPPESLLSPSQSTNGDTSESSSNIWSDISSTCDVTTPNASNESPNTAIGHRSPPLPDVEKKSHVVQFYYDEEYLYNSITSFLAPCLSCGGGAIVVATADHIKCVEKKLYARNINIDKKKSNGTLVFLDAHETLAVLQTSDGKIAESAFHNLIEKPINSIAQKCNGNVYAFGEMVDLLAQRREYHFALALEARWNKYMEHQSLTLLCGYDLSSFEYCPDGEVVQSICHLHSHVDGTVFNTGQNQNAQNHHITIVLLEQRVKKLERELERRKASEASLHTSLRIISENALNFVTCEREIYQNVLSTLPVGVYGITFGGDEEFYVNKRFCELVGREASDIRKRGWIDVIHPDDRKEMESKWPVCYHHGSRDLTIFSNQHEYRLIHADNSVIWVKAETAATNAENGNILGYIHTIMDITELKQTEKGRLEAKQAAEEHQRHRAEEAERHKQMQDQWIDSLCHELRNPLNGISGNVELIESGIDVRKQILCKPVVEGDDIQILRDQLPFDEESISAIKNCVAQQKVITDDVLNLSKLELGKLELNKGYFNLNNVLLDINKMFQAEATSKGITLSADLDETLPLVYNDPQRFSQIVINLLVNAIKFTETGTVTVISRVIETNEPCNMIKVSIQDTGIGMSKSERANLFQRFTQPTSKNTFHEYGGSGLGLYISKNLVELMGGAIQVESEKGKGSIFSFTITDEPPSNETSRSSSPSSSTVSIAVSPSSPTPSNRDALSDITLSPHIEPPVNRRIHKILVVEDNEVNQRIMLRLLRLKGYEVTVAEDGQQALSHLESTSVDLIIMDIQMPVMDGITATKEIRKIEKLEGKEVTPIIGLSGNAREFHATNALKNGLNLYMTKPVKKAELYAAIERFEVSYSQDSN